MNPQPTASHLRSKHLWGLGLFAVATATLLERVGQGHSLGTSLKTVVLVGFVVGGFLIVWAALQEPPAPSPLLAAPPLAPAAPTDGVPPHLEKALAEIAVLAWKINKRAQKEPTPPKPIVRNATRIMEMLGEHKVELVSYEGRKIDMGARVEVQEAVDGEEEDKVLAEHEPEIQVNGKLIRKALVTVGKGKKPAAALDGSNQETAKQESKL